MPHGLPTKSQYSHNLKTQVRWVKHNGLIRYTSHWTRKNKTIRLPKPECLVFPVTAIFEILDVPVSTVQFSTTSFWGTSIKVFALPPLGDKYKSFHQRKYSSLSLWNLFPSSLSNIFVIYEKSKLRLSGILFVSTSASWSNLHGICYSWRWSLLDS
jgi:hypothetical protein